MDYIKLQALIIDALLNGKYLYIGEYDKNRLAVAFSEASFAIIPKDKFYIDPKAIEGVWTDAFKNGSVRKLKDKKEYCKTGRTKEMTTANGEDVMAVEFQAVDGDTIYIDWRVLELYQPTQKFYGNERGVYIREDNHGMIGFASAIK